MEDYINLMQKLVVKNEFNSQQLEFTKKNKTA